MTLSDLFFIASVLFVLTLSFRIVLSALRRRWKIASHLSRLLGLFLAVYAAALLSVGLALPRRVYAPGQRRCFDDWCVTALDAVVADGPAGAPCPGDKGGRNWIADIEVSSDAKRVRQRALDARAELEDQQGTRYQPCAAPLSLGSGPARLLSDEIGPGESFRVWLPFRLPGGATPAGLVMHHGDFPGVVIVGADQSLLHRPALHRVALERLR